MASSDKLLYGSTVKRAVCCNSYLLTSLWLRSTCLDQDAAAEAQPSTAAAAASNPAPASQPAEQSLEHIIKQLDRWASFLQHVLHSSSRS